MIRPENRAPVTSAMPSPADSMEAKTVFKTEWFAIEEESFGHLSSLNGKPFYRLKGTDGVGILAVTRADEIILIRQYRPALKKFTLEFPSGFIDHGETPLQAAARELLEETGYCCETLVPLGTGREMMNRTCDLIWAFHGERAVKAPEARQEHGIEIVLASPAQLKQWIVGGQFEQFSGLALLMLAQVKLNWPVSRNP